MYIFSLLVLLICTHVKAINWLYKVHKWWKIKPPVRQTLQQDCTLMLTLCNSPGGADQQEFAWLSWVADSGGGRDTS